MVCISSASAVVLILVVTLWVCWWVKCLHRWGVAARQVMCWLANEGNAAGALKCEINRMWKIVNPTHQSLRIMQLFTNRKQCGWSRQVRLPPQPCLSTGRKCSLYQREQFSFQFPSLLAFSSVASGTLCSRLLLVGWFSSVPHCKKKKSTSSSVISTMKFELPFIN